MTCQWVAVLALLCSGIGCSASGGTGSNADGGSDYSNRWAGASTSAEGQPIGLLIEPGPAADLGYRLGWAASVELLGSQHITSVTVLGDMVIVIEDPVNIVTARRTDNGQLLWKIHLGSELEKIYQPSRDGEQLFFHSGTRFFTLRARDGEVQAVAPLETPVASPATYSAQNRLAIFSGSKGRIFAHSVDSNFTRWSYELANRIANPPALLEQDVFIVDTGGTYVMLETANGSPLWRNRTLGAVSTAPKVQGSEIVVASEDGKLYAFNRTTGQDTWQYLGAEQPLTADPIALGRLILQPLLPEGGIVAVNALDGAEEWRSAVNASPVVTRQGDMVLFAEDALYALDLDDGSVLMQAPTRSLQTAVPVSRDSNAIILVGPDGDLLRLNPL